MPTERVQRRIDSLLVDAETAIEVRDWPAVLARCESVLALAPDNEDAKTYLAAAERANRDASDAGPAQSQPTSVFIPEPAHPETFVVGRHRVERFLGGRAKKRVFLARENT